MAVDFRMLDTGFAERLPRNMLAMQQAREQMDMNRLNMQNQQEDRRMRNALAQERIGIERQQMGLQLMPQIARLLHADPSGQNIDALAGAYSQATGQDVSQYAMQLKQMPPEQRKQVALQLFQKYDPQGFKTFQSGNTIASIHTDPATGAITTGGMFSLPSDTKQQQAPSGYQWDGENLRPITGGPFDPNANPKKKEAPSGYRYTNSGDLEAIPGGPADAKTQAQNEKIMSGMEDLDISISTLRDAYDRLEKGGGITSIDKSAVENIGASVSSSTPGQFVGKMVGTDNQSARNEIAMSRPALLAALMKATGMSAKQMDSNAELKLWLSTATDPTLDVEANRKALSNIERKYIKRNGSQQQPKETKPQQASKIQFLGFE